MNTVLQSLAVIGVFHAGWQTAQSGQVVASYELTSAVTLHEPVFLQLSIQNGLNEPIRVDLGKNRIGSLRLRVTRNDGSVEEVPPLPIGGISMLSKISLDPLKTYSQRVLLDELYQFKEPGRYELGIRIAAPFQTRSGSPVDASTEARFAIMIRPRDEATLRQKCEELIRIVEEAPGEKGFEAAHVLSYIVDPVALPYLKRMAEANRSVFSDALNGLGRIGNDEAISILISIAEGRDHPDQGEFAKGMLAHVGLEVEDATLKARIDEYLRKTKRGWVRVRYEVVPTTSLHEPILVHLSVQNGYEGPVKFHLGRDHLGNIRIEVLKPDGSEDKIGPSTIDGATEMGTISLQPRGSYSQRILLNQLYQFKEPGRYEVWIRIVTSYRTEDDSPVASSASSVFTMVVQPRDEVRLKRKCEELIRLIEREPGENASEAATALSYISDSVALPYLKRAIEMKKSAAYLLAVDGLGRIATDDAITILISAAEDKARPDAARYAKEKLVSLQHELKDAVLKERIGEYVRKN